VERVREIFPFLSTVQIMAEIQNCRGNIDQAIINITENLQAGMYAD
jgi:hypothetical protein